MAASIVSTQAVPKQAPAYVKLMNPLMNALARVGLPVGPMALLTVRGRKTGLLRTTTVGLMRASSGTYLLSTFGDTNWVRNIRVAEEALIKRGRKRTTYSARELSIEQAAPVLREVLSTFAKGPITRYLVGMQYGVSSNTAGEDFLQVARDHPVFELRETAADRRPAWLDAAEYPFDSHFVELDGHRLHYIDEGRGPTLLFLHADPLWSFQYRDMVKALRDRFRCVALDYPGFGLSGAASGTRNSLTSLGRLVEGFIQALSLTPVTLVLHDLSVPVGLSVAQRHPDWLAGLVLANGFAWPTKSYPRIHNFLRVVSTPLVRFLFVQFNLLSRYTVKTRHFRHGKLSKAARQAYLEPFKKRSSRSVQHDLFRSIVHSQDLLADVEQRLPDIAHVPALIAFAAGDGLVKLGWLARFEQAFPSHCAVIFQDAYHFPQEDLPEEFAVAIRQWWDDLVVPSTNSGRE